MARKSMDKSQKEKRTRKISQSGSVKSRLSSNSSETPVARLQKKYSNINLQRMYESGAFQAKLKIGKPGDKYEREADRVADRVMNMPKPDISRQENDEEEIQTKSLADQLTPLVQGQPEEEEEIAQANFLQRPEEEEEEPAQTKMLQPQVEEEEEVQKQTEEEEEPVQTKILQRQDEEEEEPAQAKNIDNKSGTISSNVENSIHTIRGSGQPLPESTRAFFESRFETDFSGVKVHAGSNANYLAKSINARAFTIGKDVIFGSGQYSPESLSGKQLLAHELTHVVQQSPRLKPPKNIIGRSWGKGIRARISRRIAYVSDYPIIYRWTLAGTIGKLCPDKDGKKSIKLINSQKYKVYSYDNYTYKRQYYTDATKTTKAGPPEPHRILGYHARSKREIALNVKRSDEKAASTLVHEVVHARQHMKYEAALLKDPLAKAPTKAEKEYEAHIKQEEFNIRNKIPPKHPSFRKKVGSKYVPDKPAIRKWVDKVYAIGPKKFYTNYDYKKVGFKGPIGPWACP